MLSFPANKIIHTVQKKQEAKDNSKTDGANNLPTETVNAKKEGASNSEGNLEHTKPATTLGAQEPHRNDANGETLALESDVLTLSNDSHTPETLSAHAGKYDKKGPSWQDLMKEEKRSTGGSVLVTINRDSGGDQKLLKAEDFMLESDFSSVSDDSAENSEAGVIGEREKSIISVGEKHRPKMVKNFSPRRCRHNSYDSASSTEAGSGRKKRVKQDDGNRMSFALRFSAHKTLDVSESHHRVAELRDTEIAIANSPVYSTGRSRSAKPRPAPITGQYELELLQGLVDEDAIKNNMLLKEEAANMLSNEAVGDEEMVCQDPVTSPASSAKETARRSHSAGPAITTVTGSVNDETLLMEDKDNGLDLSCLLDVTNVSKNRLVVRQKGEKNPRAKGCVSTAFV